jgi:hypothetical protein
MGRDHPPGGCQQRPTGRPDTPHRTAGRELLGLEISADRAPGPGGLDDSGNSPVTCPQVARIPGRPALERRAGAHRMTASSPRNPAPYSVIWPHPEGCVPVLSHVYRTTSLTTNGNAALHKNAQAELAHIGVSGSRRSCPSADAPDLFDMAAQPCAVDARTEQRLGERLFGALAGPLSPVWPIG